MGPIGPLKGPTERQKGEGEGEGEEMGGRERERERGPRPFRAPIGYRALQDPTRTFWETSRPFRILQSPLGPNQELGTKYFVPNNALAPYWAHRAPEGAIGPKWDPMYRILQHRKRAPYRALKGPRRPL